MSGVRLVKTNQVDLNLLVALNALLEERNVTKAAERLFVGQPAMSASLARLRRVFDDPLLMRTGRTLSLTPLAQSLIEPLRDVLAGIEGLLTLRPDFDPAHDPREFVLLGSDYVTLVLLRRLVRALDEEAPRIVVRVKPIGNGLDAELERGDTDLMIVPSEISPQLKRFPHQQLFEERYVAVVWRENPDVGDHITPEQFASLPHLGYNPGGLPALSEARLEALGIDRNVEVTTQTFVMGPLLVRGTRLLAIVHERVALELREGAESKVLELPYDLGRVTETMFWHPRNDADPAHRWLRERVATLAAQL